jgi:methylated-DNA-[protein]-cysteine S-methyltransferase
MGEEATSSSPAAPPHGYARFDTPIGACAIAWGERGIVAVQLPESDDDETCARILDRVPDAEEAVAPVDVERVVDAIGALLRGERSDLASVRLDMGGVPPFHRRVYETARSIPVGETMTYGELAAEVGSPGAARAVGQALGRNPFAIVVPCHRVTAAGGRLGGFAAPGGATTKRRLLELEGTAVGFSSG